MRITDTMIDAAWQAYDNAPARCSNEELMRAAIEAALAESWRPIEDAPHGVEVLLATPPFECMGEQAKWEFRVGRASWGERIGGFSNRSMDAHATHWMPLPPAPISHEKEN